MAEYYVMTKGDEHSGFMDGCIVWWGPSGRGYTTNLDKAGVYTDEDRASGYPSPETCIYVPKKIVDDNSSTPRLAWWSDMSKRAICEALKRASEGGVNHV